MSDPAGLEEYESMHSDMLSDEGGDAESSGSGSEKAPERVQPSFAQYVDEEDLDDDEDDEEEISEDEASDASGSDEDDGDLEHLQKEMRSLPFSALVRAKASLGRQRGDSPGSEDLEDSEEDEFEADRHALATGKRKRGSASAATDEKEAERERKRAEVRERLRQLGGGGDRDGAPKTERESRDERERRTAKESRELAKRVNKHAPTEITARRPVSRKRNVVDLPASRARDPRFDSLSGGPANAGLFERSYSFLPSVYGDEISELKASYAALRKQEAHHAGPRAQSSQAIAIREEKERVERALRRAEGRQKERERRDQEAQLRRRMKKENEERVQKGGKAFYLKDSDKRALLLKEKYDRLSGGGGSGSGPAGAEKASGVGDRKALRKALERRRKKNTQKERKDMPLGASEGAVPKRMRAAGSSATGGSPGGKPRDTAGSEAPRPRKRGKRGGS